MAARRTTWAGDRTHLAETRTGLARDRTTWARARTDLAGELFADRLKELLTATADLSLAGRQPPQITP
jgi:hypothetical protein